MAPTEPSVGGPNVSRWIIAAQALVIAVLAGLAIAAAQGAFSNVQVRVWQDARDDRNLYLSARYEGGSWRALGTVPVDMSRMSTSGRWRYGDITLTVPVPDDPVPPEETDAAQRRCENEALAALRAAEAAYQQALAAYVERVTELDQEGKEALDAMLAAQAEADRVYAAAIEAAGEDEDAIRAAETVYQAALAAAMKTFNDGEAKRVSEREALDRTYQAAGAASDQAVASFGTAMARCDDADR